MRSLPIILLVVVGLAGCAHYKAENPALTEYPGIQSQIENYYDQYATEEDWTCTLVQLNTIDKSKVVSQTASQVVVAVSYFFKSIDEGLRGPSCEGFNTRFFTFNKDAGGQLGLVSMSGPQRRQGG